MSRRDRGVLSVRFNQDQGCFTCCTESALRIFNVDPLAEKANLDVNIFGTIGQCEMLFRTNIIAFVAGGRRPKYADNAVLIYDDAEKKLVLELIFTSPVKSVRLRRDKIVVATLYQINVFSFPDSPRRLFTLDTRPNPLGLCEVTPILSAERHLVVFPGHKVGSVQLIDLAHTEENTSKSPMNLNAHQNDIACLALNSQGTLLATGSVKGTLIRVWDTFKRNLLVELRRGSDTAVLHCIQFSHDAHFLACSSDKGTVHIFAIKDTSLNSRLSKGILGSYDSLRAMATFTVPPECPCVCAFGQSGSSIVAVCLDGTFHKYVFNSDGKCNREAYDVYLDIYEEDDF